MKDLVKEKIQSLVPEVIDNRFEEGYYTVQFSYIGTDDKEHAEIFSINEQMDFVSATNLAEKHASEFGKHRIHSVFKNTHMKEILGSPITLAVVLQAIATTWKAIYGYGGIMPANQHREQKNIEYLLSVWNLTKDSYDDQSEETKAFIGKLLGV